MLGDKLEWDRPNLGYLWHSMGLPLLRDLRDLTSHQPLETLRPPLPAFPQLDLELDLGRRVKIRTWLEVFAGPQGFPTLVVASRWIREAVPYSISFRADVLTGGLNNVATWQGHT